MSAASLFGAFLQARRTQLTPEALGLRTGGERRRVAGLRREEVAALANISIDYYTRLEQGRVAPPSPDVLEALARALQLDAAGRDYLRDVAARTGDARPP